MKKTPPEIDQDLVEYLEGDRATLRGIAPITSVIPSDVVRKVRGSLPHIPKQYFASIQVEYKLTDGEQEFIDACARRWNISFERAYTRVMRKALASFRHAVEFSMSFDDLSDF